MLKNYINLIFFIVLSSCLFSGAIYGQQDSLPIYNYTDVKTYEIGGIKVTGAKFADENAVILLTGLKVGDKITIPSDKFQKVIKSLWNIKLFTDVEIIKERTVGDVVFLEIRLTERPRLSRYSFKGVKKSQHEDLNKSLDRFLTKGAIVTEDVIANSKNQINKFYKEKGYLDVKTNVIEKADSSSFNSVILTFEVAKGKKVKIRDITFSGNENVSSRKLRKQMENTKRKRKLFASSKLMKEEYDQDKLKIIGYYNNIGYRDAQIASDSIWRKKGDLMIHMNISEGRKYYFRNIAWKGNTLHTDEELAKILGIAKGDVYNHELLEARLRFSQDGRDVSSIYMDDGYLFFNVDPVETAIDGDSIDLELRIFEGGQATIDRVVIKGNDRTHEHVIRRELYTKPGQKFSRNDIIRSQRQIIALGYFNPEKLSINTPVNPSRQTVDIEYTVEEKPSDQLELSAGYGQYSGILGTLGVVFNNFSLRNIKNKEAWNPLPQGDGQRLSLRAQTNGSYYQSYNASFTEPWLGGKKPMALSVGGSYTKIAYGVDKTSPDYSSLAIGGLYVGLQTRLKWPDDNFLYGATINLNNNSLRNYTGFIDDNGVAVKSGSFNNFNLQQTLTRTTIGDPIFPKDGSKISLMAQLTLPYSLFRKGNINDLTPEEKYRWIEYHKWKITADWYKTIVDKLVLRANIKVGMLGTYNKELGVTPFERYELGGNGLTNQNSFITGKEIYSMRGYNIEDIAANSPVQGVSTIMNKFSVELRYPISLNPSATIFILGFVDAGNSYVGFKNWNPFNLYRSAGLGLRVYLPMFGILGFDYGLGFDKVTSSSASNVFSKYGTFNIILGFEPE